MKTKWKLPVILGCIVSMMLSGCSSVSRETDKSETSTETENTASAKETVRTGTWETAAQTPYGAYPELVTYTLGDERCKQFEPPGWRYLRRQCLHPLSPKDAEHPEQKRLHGERRPLR